MEQKREDALSLNFWRDLAQCWTKKFENHLNTNPEPIFLSNVKIDSKNLISASFNPNYFQLYKTVYAHLVYNNLKRHFSKYTICPENQPQNAPIASCAPLLKTIKNRISTNTDSSKLPRYRVIGVNIYYKYFR